VHDDCRDGSYQGGLGGWVLRRMVQSAGTSLRHLKMSQKAFAIGGVGSQPTLDDVVRIAEGIHVALDPAGYERVKKASPAPKSFQAETCDAAPSTSGTKLSFEQCRAVVATKLLQLMNGRSGSMVQIAEFLVALLNAGTVPSLSGQDDDAATLRGLALACHGLGSSLTATSSDQALSDAITKLGAEAPKLSASERVVMEGGAAATAGIATLAVQGGKKMLSLASAAAALSIEAVCAQVRMCCLHGLHACCMGAAWDVCPALLDHALPSCCHRRSPRANDSQRLVNMPSADQEPGC
jgi:hypothetical protein